MTSCSRSSLASKIFGAHDIWWGSRLFLHCGYPTYESYEIKQLLKKHWRGLVIGREADSSPTRQFLTELMSVVPHDQRWLFKVGVEHFNCFAPLQPFNVFITRPVNEVLDSWLRKHPRANARQILSLILWRFGYMAKLHAMYGGVVLDTSLLISGNYAQLDAAFRYCELPPPDVQKIQDAIIKPSKKPAPHAPIAQIAPPHKTRHVPWES